MKVFEYVYKCRKDLTSPKLASFTLRRRILPNVSDRAFLNILSDLVKDIEVFMMIDELQGKERSYDRKKILSEIYKKKGLYKFFERTTNDIIKDLEASQSIDLFENLRWLEVHHSLYFSDLYDKNSKPIEALTRAEQELNLFSENLKLYYQTEAFNIKVLLKDKSFDSPEYSPDSTYKVLKYLYLVTSERNEEAYQQLTRRLFDNTQLISAELSQAILICLINYCYYRIKSGDSNIINDLAELNIFGMNSGALLHNDRLSETRFLNIVDTISKSAITISMKELISEWIKKVNSKNLRSVEQMALALWAFGRGAYGETLQTLNGSDIRLTHGNLSFRSRWMYICSLCSEYPDYDEKEEVIKSSLIFFRRHKHEMNDQTFRGSINLVSVVKLIWNNREVGEIKSFIEACDFIMFRWWINQTIEIRESKGRSQIYS